MTTDNKSDGLALLIRYNELKKRLNNSTAMLIALRDSGGPGRGGARISTESLIREVLRVSRRRQEILRQMCAIEEAVGRLDRRSMRLIQWRYFLKAKREPIARRLGVSLRHYSRLKAAALEALGGLMLSDPEVSALLRQPLP